MNAFILQIINSAQSLIYIYALIILVNLSQTISISQNGVICELIAATNSLKVNPCTINETNINFCDPKYNFLRCSPYSVITSIILQSTSISGTLPTSLGELNALTSFDVSFNSLHGTIPSTIFKLSNLVHFSISYNSFIGTLPTSLGLMTSLKTIWCTNNKLQGTIPSAIGNIQSLLSLRLCYNSFSGTIPTALGQLSSITFFRLYSNKISGFIPTTFYKLSNIRVLDFGKNSLTGKIPSIFRIMSSLVTFRLSYNKLTGTIPNIFENMDYLTVFALDHNQLSGSIPDDMFFSSYYYSIHLENNLFTGVIPYSLSYQILLNELYLSNNKLTGTLPDYFQNMFALANIELHSNKLTGTIPSNIASTSLTVLNIADNKLHGSVSSLLCSSSLKQIYFYNNPNLGCYSNCLVYMSSVFAGTVGVCEESNIICDLVSSTNAVSVLNGWDCDATGIPTTSVCNGNWEGIQCSVFNTLDSLIIPSTNLRGTLPSSLGLFTYIGYIDISHNQLFGIIPTSLSHMTQLLYLYLDDNSLTGTLPSSLGSMSSLIELNLHSNNLNGTIPFNLAGDVLTMLDLSYNQLMGSVPSGLCGTFLRSLSFNNNTHLGCYSSCLSSIISVQVGSLTNCAVGATLCDLVAATNIGSKLSGWSCIAGRIPSTSICGGYWKGVQCEDKSVVSLSLSSLSISGTLPSTLGLYSTLSHLDLSNNKLFGTFPSSIELLSGLVHFTVNSNQFNGSFPTPICQITSLLSLSLGHNQFTSSLPTCIISLHNLISLSAAGNLFSGSIPSVFHKLSNLQTLELQSNKLEGPLSSNNILGVSLNLLDISDNQLTGSLPSTLCTSITLTTLRLANNSGLICYPQCLSSLTSFVYGELDVCTLTVTTHRHIFSLLYLILVCIGSTLICCIISAIVYYITHRKVTILTASRIASKSIMSASLLECIQMLGHDRSLHHGTIVLKTNEEYREVDILVDTMSVEFRKKYELLYELHELNPLVFAKSYGYVKDDILDCSSLIDHQMNIHPRRSTSLLRNMRYSLKGTFQSTTMLETTALSNSSSMTVANTTHKIIGNKSNLAGIVLELSESTYFSYVHHLSLNGSSIQENLMKEEEYTETQGIDDDNDDLIFYRKGIVATSLIHIVLTGLRKDLVFCGLSPYHLMVYDSSLHVKLADLDGTMKLRDIISKIEIKPEKFFLHSQSPTPTTITYDRYFPILCPELATAFIGMNIGNACELTIEMAIWHLGTLLFEVLTEIPFTTLLVNDNILMLKSFAMLTQEDVNQLIDEHCASPRNYLRNKLLKLLLKIDPSERLQEVAPHLYFESQDDNLLCFFIVNKVPANIIIDLLITNPEYNKRETIEGQSVIQLALQYDSEPLLIEYLLRVFTSSYREKALHCGDQQTLLQYALEKNMSDDHTRVLLPYFMPIDANDGVELPSETHGFGWTNVIGHLHPPDKYVDTIAYILKDYTRHIKSLAYCVDELGRTALNIATPKCKEEIIKILYFLGTYDLKHETAHQSNTCIVRVGVNTKENTRVALKFMKLRESFYREVMSRSNEDFSDDYVLGFLYAMDGDVDTLLQQELNSKGYEGYKYLIVMPEAERTLQDIIAHEHIAGKDWDKIRGLCTQLTQAVRHVHNTGLIHGDIKPLNVMRVRGRLVLIDLDACVSYKEGQYAGAKYSSAYIPPEMVHLIESNNGPKPIVKTFFMGENMHPITNSECPYELQLAHPSYDMWALGVTLFQICTGKPLFVIDNEDNIDDKTLIQLSNWTDSYKTELLSIVPDPLARNLLSQLLNKNPERRPSADRVLAHPFLSGKVAARLPGELPEFDVFISYRVGADAHHVERLYDMLTTKEIRVWWDRKCLEAGKPWEEGFCNGLAKSMAFVPFLSREAINSDLYPTRQNFTHLTADSPCDNVFLEHRLALEMRAMGLIELIYPVMIGDHTEGMYNNYFTSGCHPQPNNIIVNAVEEKVIEHLDRQGLGAPLGTTTTVSGVLGELLKNQGGFIEGPENIAFDTVVNKIVAMIRSGTTKISGLTRFRNAVNKVLQIRSMTKISRMIGAIQSEKYKEDFIDLQNELKIIKKEVSIITLEKVGLEKEIENKVFEVFELKEKNNMLIKEIEILRRNNSYIN